VPKAPHFGAEGIASRAAPISVLKAPISVPTALPFGAEGNAPRAESSDFRAEGVFTDRRFCHLVSDSKK